MVLLAMLALHDASHAVTTYNTLEVGAGRAFVDLQTAIDAASDGDVIVLYEIQFNGDYLVHGGKTPRTLTMRSGIGGTTLFPVTSHALDVRGDTLVLQGLTVDGDGLHQLAHVDDGGTLRLENALGQHGAHNGNGACIEVFPGAHLELIDSHLSDCQTTSSGGALWIGSSGAIDATLLLERTEIDTSAGNDGGALLCQGQCTLIDAHLHDNDAGDDGGAVFTTVGSTLSVTGGLFQGNEAAGGTGSGGAMTCSDQCTIDGAVFVDNHAPAFGGAIRLNAFGSVVHSRFCANSANDGGAFHASQGGEITESVFWANNATTNGGAIYVNSSSDNLLATQLTFYDNSADNHGEAAYRGASETTLTASILSNHKGSGQALLGENGPGTFDSDQVLFSDNVAAYHMGDGTDTNALTGDPMFVHDPDDYDPVTDCATIDLRLQSGSAAIVGKGYVGAEVPCTDEIVGNGVDEDCDGLDACYRDLDSDGWGDGPAVPGSLLCVGANEATLDGDCDDARPDVNPGEKEVCDNDHTDNDCNGLDDVEEELTTTYYLDGDTDGWGDIPEELCEESSTHVLQDGDCDDFDDEVNPGEKEVCYNNKNDDCSALTPDSCDTADIPDTAYDTGTTEGPTGDTGTLVDTAPIDTDDTGRAGGTDRPTIVDGPPTTDGPTGPAAAGCRCDHRAGGADGLRGLWTRRR